MDTKPEQKTKSDNYDHLSAKVTGCRSCGETQLKPVLSLGHTPLANRLLSEAQLQEQEPTWPLELVRCPECSLVQITETVSPELLFGHYAYFSSFSETMVAHAKTVAEKMVKREQLNHTHLAVEIASNDGYLLQWYRDLGVPILGIEPARNIAEAANKRGVPTRCEFFGRACGQRLFDESIRADVVHANNVLAHVADLNGFVAGLKLLLNKTGVAVIEVPYLKPLIDSIEFDTIYHEHLCYFSLTALKHLFERHRLKVVDVEQLPIHGGSLRLYVGHEESSYRSTLRGESIA